MDNFAKLYDFIQIKSDSKLDELPDTSKVQLVDYIGKGTTPGLKVKFDLSASGRVINGRIYTPWGQESGKGSWTEPFPKPILREHRKSEDPIGRITQVDNVSLEKEAIEYFGDIRKYLEVKKAYDSKSNKQIHQVMSKYSLYEDKKWPGLTKLVATARISDKDAIQKFVDERYLTFSSGAETDSYTCLLCDSEWHKGNICDHRPGKADDEGNRAYFITGAYLGDEASVVNAPANSTSIVKSIEFEDSLKNLNEEEFTNVQVSDSSPGYSMTDSVMEIPDQKRILTEDYILLDTKVLVGLVGTDALKTQEVLDAIDGTTLTEKEWVRRLNDDFHMAYDYRIGETIPKEVYIVHSKCHQIADSQGFRDSFTNGPLDGYDADGNEIAGAYDGKKEKEEVPVVDNAVAADPAVEILAELATITKDTELVDDIDWFTLDLALNSLVPEASRLSQEAITALGDDVFCGPRAFPIPDTEYLKAAQTLIEKYKGNSKELLTALIAEKAACLSDKANKVCNCKDKIDALQADYLQALKQIDDIGKEVTALMTDRVSAEELIEFSKLSILDQTRKLIDSTNKKTGQESATQFNIKEVKDRGITSEKEVDSQKLKTLGAFEQDIVKKYHKLLEDNGREIADKWLQSKSVYLPRNFDPNKFI